MPPTEGQAWKYFNTVVKEKNGNRLSSCRFCEKTFSGSHGRHVAHFDPTDMSVGTCEKAPEGVPLVKGVHVDCEGTNGTNGTP